MRYVGQMEECADDGEPKATVVASIIHRLIPLEVQLRNTPAMWRVDISYRRNRNAPAMWRTVRTREENVAGQAKRREERRAAPGKGSAPRCAYVCTKCGWIGSSRARHSEKEASCPAVPCLLYYMPGQNYSTLGKEYLERCTEKQVGAAVRASCARLPTPAKACSSLVVTARAEGVRPPTRQRDPRAQAQRQGWARPTRALHERSGGRRCARARLATHGAARGKLRQRSQLAGAALGGARPCLPRALCARPRSLDLTLSRRAAPGDNIVVPLDPTRTRTLTIPHGKVPGDVLEVSLESARARNAAQRPKKRKGGDAAGVGLRYAALPVLRLTEGDRGGEDRQRGRSAVPGADADEQDAPADAAADEPDEADAPHGGRAGRTEDDGDGEGDGEGDGDGEGEGEGEGDDEGNEGALERGEFYIKELLERRVNHLTGGFEYLVRWGGFGDEEDSWEPADGLPEDACREFDKAQRESKRRRA